MKTPIYDFLTEYSASGMLRCHMPGHKGKALRKEYEFLYSHDLTEIHGADSLFEADGIISESERTMSALYGSTATAYSVGGSTLCIQAMLAIMKQENRRVFAVRNVHRAFLNASALLGLAVEWIFPDYSNGILSGELDYVQIEEIISVCEEKCCLYVTSPDYTGKTADIKRLAGICRRYGARLLVDNAHGAHLAFLPENIHPISLGADLCCDSAHKMLPALTGAAMLHTSLPEYADKLKQSMSLFASTSPSYPIMMSLDLCTEYISERIRFDISENLRHINVFKEHFRGRLIFSETEPFHITLNAAASRLNGIEFAEILRENGIECEYADRTLIILLMSPVCCKEDYETLTDVIEKALAKLEISDFYSDEFTLKPPEKIMEIREAVLAPSEEINIDDAEGRICASVKVPCPPAIPIAASGECINRECINIFKKYGISRINVLK